MQQINYPFYIDSRGRVASPDYDEHIRQMIEQVLFTWTGERVNRPDFGTGLQQLIFAPNNGELAAATQFLVQGALEQWLGDLIELEAVEVENDDSQLTVTVQYIVKRTLERRLDEFFREI
jgi:phage baseplate assembly protein W